MTNNLPYHNSKTFRELIATIIKEHLANSSSYTWLQESCLLIGAQNNSIQLQVCFAAISRKIDKKIIQINSEQKIQLSTFLPGLFIEGWTLHRLCRMYILQNLKEEEDKYCTEIGSLFTNAEMNELADLYSALPVLAYPKHWIKFCEEGIRSNMGVVQEAIMYKNPFPAKYLSEAAWNQLVLKAFFTEKNITLITGIDERANSPLALTLIDYAQERRAAKRSVNVQLWRLVAPFIDDSNFVLINELFHSEDEKYRQVAALVCSVSTYAPAKLLLNKMPELKTAINKNKLNWDTI